MILDPTVMIEFSKLGVLSPNGRCRSFDQGADGYVRSEGCGVVIIKPLEAALRDGDHIYCVVRGSACNSDGKRSPSLTMPNGGKLQHFVVTNEHQLIIFCCRRSTRGFQKSRATSRN
jgi:acyl transferase domain-containing protein